MKRTCFLAAAGLIGWLGCSGEGEGPPAGGPAQAGPGAPGSTSPPASDGSPDGGGPSGACDAKSEGICTAWNARSVCKNGAWAKEICAAGEGCVRGACVKEQCSDECTLGEGTCSTFDM